METTCITLNTESDIIGQKGNILEKLPQKDIHCGFFSVMPGLNQPLHVLCFLSTKFMKKKRKCNKRCQLPKKEKKNHFTNINHFVFKDSENNKRCQTEISGEWSSCCHWLMTLKWQATSIIISLKWSEMIKAFPAYGQVHRWYRSLIACFCDTWVGKLGSFKII